MKFHRGDVVLVNFPFAGGEGGKVRPAVVVQCDRNNSRLDNTILVQVTGRTQHAASEPTQLLIRVNTQEGRASGLLRDSIISCENLFTVRQDAIQRRIGRLLPQLMEQLKTCLVASLELG